MGDETAEEAVLAVRVFFLLRIRGRLRTTVWQRNAASADSWYRSGMPATVCFLRMPVGAPARRRDARLSANTSSSSIKFWLLQYASSTSSSIENRQSGSASTSGSDLTWLAEGGVG